MPRPRKNRSARTAKRQAPHRPRRPNVVLLYGRHAVAAALANPDRRAMRLKATERGLAELSSHIAVPASLPVEVVEPAALAATAPPEAPTQGLLLEAEPLPARALEDYPPQPGERSLIVVLDQVEDPHNVGAVLRSAAVFGARALVTQDRHAPSESGALAKAASGALDMVPWVRATNLAAALDRLAEMGYWRIGLEGTADARIGEADLGDALALVLGAEGRGLRPLTVQHCDLLAAIPSRSPSRLIDSLNVSNAAAVALYALSRTRA